MPFAWRYLLDVIMQKDRVGSISYKRTVEVGLIILLSFIHFYQLVFSSWVADYYSSKKTAELAWYFSTFNPGDPAFIYDVPEIVIFLPENVQYYQHIYFSGPLKVGDSQLEVLASGAPIVVITKRSSLQESKYLANYNIKEEVGSYVILER
jgi:hypothetical protein